MQSTAAETYEDGNITYNQRNLRAFVYQFLDDNRNPSAVGRARRRLSLFEKVAVEAEKCPELYHAAYEEPYTNRQKLEQEFRCKVMGGLEETN